jgi:acyl dehydratase
MKQASNFKKPVYLGDTVIGTVTVMFIDKIKRRVLFDTICEVQNKIVIDGCAESYVL